MSMGDNLKKNGPLVTVLISTYNRPRYLAEALASIFAQSYENFEVILTRDGGQGVSHVVEQFDDERLIFVDRDHNRGLAYSFNRALERARGKYVCYLGDDDLFYPDHIETLVDALERNPQYKVAYTDLYKTHCRIEEDGSRTVLAKNVEISRDFDRWIMFHFNHSLHVSVMHDRQLFMQAGGYNEKLDVLIDWDMTRKLCFYTDFFHIHKITGEFYAPVHDCDRISVKKRKNVNEYMINLLTIRTTRPPKPWPRTADLSVVILGESLDRKVVKLIQDIWSHSFFPHQVYLPFPEQQLKGFKSVVPNLVGVPLESPCPAAERMDAALEVCEGEYTAIVPADYEVDLKGFMWVEKSLWPLMKLDEPNTGFMLPDLKPGQFGGVFRTDELRRARDGCRQMDIEESIASAGIIMRETDIEQYPFQFDFLLAHADRLENEGRYRECVKVFEHLWTNYQNEHWMKTRCANVFNKLEAYEKTIQLIGPVNREKPTPSTLLLEARAHKGREDFVGAIGCYEKAKSILDGRELTWNL